MATSMKLANHTYPGLQELYFRLRKWTDANFSPITLDHQLPFLSKYRRKELYDRLFQSVTFILEQLHPGYQQIDGLPCAQPCRTLNILQPWSFNTFMNLNCCCNCLIQSYTSMMPTVITETIPLSTVSMDVNSGPERDIRWMVHRIADEGIWKRAVI